MTGSIPTSSLLLWCFMSREEYNEKRRRSRSRFDWSSDYRHWVALWRAILERVRGSACSHNNRVIEVIIWRPGIAPNEQRLEVAVYSQSLVRCGVLLCGADVFFHLCLVQFANSHACWDLWVKAEHTAKVMMCKSWCSAFVLSASDLGATSSHRLRRVLIYLTRERKSGLAH